MRKLYLKSTDVAAVLGISRRCAENMMAMFEMHGDVVRLSPQQKSSPKLIHVRKLAGFLAEQDGGHVDDRVEEIYECLEGGEN